MENTVLNAKILVFFDTNIFRNEGFDFQNRYFYTHMLELKTKFPNLSIMVFPVLYHEIVAQMNETLEKYINQVTALKQSLDNNKFGSYAHTLDLSRFNVQEFRDTKVNELKEFLSSFTEEENFELSNQMIQYNTVEVLSDFFEKNAPFSDKKKYEFKDAFLIQNIKQAVSDPEYRDWEIFIVSEDKGFIKGVKEKIGERLIIHQTSNDFFNSLSKKEERYQLFYSYVLRSDFSGFIYDKINEYKGYNVEKYILENEGIFIDGRDIDRKGYNHGYDYDEICITKFKLVNPASKINIINIDDSKANVEINYQIEVSFTGSEDNGDYEDTTVVDEKHISSIDLNVELEEIDNEIQVIRTDIGRIVLNKNTFRERSQPRYVYSRYYDDIPYLSASKSQFIVTCDNCKNNSKFDSPTSEDFESGLIGEGGMGDWVQHTYHFNEYCNECGNVFNGEIVITEYPYLVINNIEIECEGGQVESLNFHYS
ncbi:TPA: PIN domain-containing protein [Streptococcus suis]